jgi:hypothetical protein
MVGPTDGTSASNGDEAPQRSPSRNDECSTGGRRGRGSQRRPPASRASGPGNPEALGRTISRAGRPEQGMTKSWRSMTISQQVLRVTTQCQRTRARRASGRDTGTAW